MSLPEIVFVGGKKRSGKDFVADRLVEEAGFTKCHIVRPWLERFCERNGIAWDEYEAEKHRWRAQIQDEATEARRLNPNCLVDEFRRVAAGLPRPLVVTAVRFRNEAELGHELGALVLRVWVHDKTRRERFEASGEDVAMLEDPFEAEVDRMRVHADVSGALPADMIVPRIRAVWGEVCAHA